jgi:ATP-dependent DNA ligase
MITPANGCGDRMAVLKNEAFAPELTKLVSTPPIGDDWLHAVKWNGHRIVATAVRGTVRLKSGNAVEWTAKIPELGEAVASLKLSSAAQLDGEMIVPSENSGSDFNALKSRLSAENKVPIVYVLFDVPYLEGKSLRDSRSFSAQGDLGCAPERRVETRSSSIPNTRSVTEPNCSPSDERRLGGHR